ncbi:hypothetical protein GobsT_59900 [Gemmata obscuriglobus]|nr:hypothetical protein GobsT_59900 [Gemmata obscuriglobus]VTS10507.1 unnamed protein product [Gemmata obscuriglobus UQM 2246]
MRVNDIKARQPIRVGSFFRIGLGTFSSARFSWLTVFVCGVTR